MNASKRHNLPAVNENGNQCLAKNADLNKLLAYWNEKRDGRSFPQRADLDPIDLRFMLDRISLVEIHGTANRRYKLRLVGSWWVQKFGVEGTGTWVEDWPNPTQRQVTLASYEALIMHRRPVLVARNAIADGNVLDFELLLLPFSEDGTQISLIVVGLGPADE